MKKIKDAVIELAGKLPNRTYTKYSNVAGWYISRCGKLTHAVDCVWFEPEEFESCAKRMGYINGYLWGKEYPTNGNRPDLADDVEVWWKNTDNDEAFCKVGELHWDWVSHPVTQFKITDPRHKPVDEAPDHIVDANEKVGDSWHERRELPPVGTKCLCWFDNGRECWHECFVIGSIDSEIKNGYLAVSLVGEHERKLVWANEFRPIKSHREKVIEAAISIARGGLTKEMYSALYDAGMLVLP